MATARALSRLAKAKLPRSVDQELGVYVLEKCREVVEEYTELSRRAPDAFPFCERDLVTWYAEIRYKLLGAARCSLCGAHVRHALPVVAEIDDNTVILHTCLCPHCMAAQESAARRVVVCLHRPVFEWSRSAEAPCAA